MKSLLVDSGNTSIKYGIWDDGSFNYSGSLVASTESIGILSEIPIEHVFISDVASRQAQFRKILMNHRLHFLNPQMDLPFTLDYITTETLGADRIAAVAFAAEKYSSNCLIIDLGTCITVDFLDKSKSYHGGSISPGLNSRFKSMHDYTGSLPLIGSSDIKNVLYPGKSTKDSMIIGVIEGIRSELQNIIDQYNNKYDDLSVIMGGGDKKFFESKLKGNIFAAENLILEGLSSIRSFHDTH